MYKVIKADYQGLCLPSDESLETNYTFQDKRWRTSADKVKKRSGKLIRKGAAGIWLWNSEMEAANYQSLKKIENPLDVFNRLKARFSGWATVGPPGHSPPSKDKIPKKALENIKAYRWCWYKDRWLLFSLLKL